MTITLGTCRFCMMNTTQHDIQQKIYHYGGHILLNNHWGTNTLEDLPDDFADNTCSRNKLLRVVHKPCGQL